MIIVGSVRPGRAGLPVAEWVRSVVDNTARFELDFADLAEIALPFMDEPEHPIKRRYTKPHTIAWSNRVDAADAFIFVAPEYNHSFAPALKNALDFLWHEWKRKPVGIVSYGGVAAGARGVVALESALTATGLVKARSNVEIPFIAKQVADGVFMADERQRGILDKLLEELAMLADALRPLR